MVDGMSTPKEHEMVEREPTKEQCVAWFELWQQGKAAWDDSLSLAILSFLRAPALVLSEVEREDANDRLL
jgi:hypothetical protein